MWGRVLIGVRKNHLEAAKIGIEVIMIRIADTNWLLSARHCARLCSQDYIPYFCEKGHYCKYFLQRKNEV
jgi:hypothetical protein